MEWLQSAVERARERFGTSDEYPLIDDGEILNRNVIYECWPWEHGHPGRQNRDALIESALTSNHNDLPVHFVWLNLFYRLAHYPADDVATVVEDRENAGWHRKEFLADLKALVGLTQEEARYCRDPRRLRWEITNACIIQDWDRAMALIERLKSCGAITESECRGLKGQVYVCSIVAPKKEAEDQGEEGQVEKDVPGWWVPKMDQTYFTGGELGSWIRPLGLLTWGLKLTDGSEYSAGEREKPFRCCTRVGCRPQGQFRAAWSVSRSMGQVPLPKRRLSACGEALRYSPRQRVRIAWRDGGRTSTHALP
jgi:hypothetical protein